MTSFARLMFEEVLKERSTASHLMRALSGKVDSINSYLMLTAENQYGEAQGEEENAQQNKELEDKIRAMGLGFVKVKGKFFGNSEHSYFIPNVSEEQAKQLGKDFKQESIIHGEKVKSSSGQPMMRHKYITGDEVVKTRHNFHQLSRELDDMYTTVQGRKFEIPFFDPETRGQAFHGGKVEKDPTVQDVDIDAPASSAESDKVRSIEKSAFLRDKMKLVNPLGHEVWVNKKNAQSYRQRGYKVPKG